MIRDGEVFERIYNVLTTEYDVPLVTDETLDAPSEFPCVSVIEIDAHSYERGETIDNTDSQRKSTFEVQIYSNLAYGGTTEVKELMEVVEGEFRSMFYRCRMNQPIPNGDKTIKRRVGRFTRVIGEGDTLPTQ